MERKSPSILFSQRVIVDHALLCYMIQISEHETNKIILKQKSQLSQQSNKKCSHWQVVTYNVLGIHHQHGWNRLPD
jgi:hypothetical protein